MRITPPKKQKGYPTGARRLNGALMDVATIAAKYYGSTEENGTKAEENGTKAKKNRAETKVRSDVARGLLPYHRFGGRIVFLDDEVMEFFRRLPGVTVAEALANDAERRSSETHSIKDDMTSGQEWAPN